MWPLRLGSLIEDRRSPGEEREEAEADRETDREELVEKGQVGEGGEFVVVRLLEKDQ